MFSAASHATWWSRTAAEITEIADRDGSVVVLPVASVEQHGDHLPVGTDSLLVEAVVNGAIERLDDAIPLLVTPPIWSGYSPHHLAFGGTLTVEFEALLDLIGDIGGSALENGFDALVLVNGHGGNAAHVTAATSIIGRDHPEAEVLGLTYFSLAESFVDDVRESEPGGMAHGGEFETSLMLHFHPDLVRTDRIAGDLLDEPYDHALADMFVPGPVSVYRPFDDYSASGAIGAPELASAEKGRELAEGLVAELAALLGDVHRRNRSTDG